MAAHPTIHENFPLTIGSSQDCDYSKMDKSKSASDEDEPSFMEDASKGKKASQWHRVKWTDTMVRLLITAVSYITEEAIECTGGSRRKLSNLQKKGKWKSVSKVMAERGHFVSPQQCEDKFNDLNKRYKRLNEILGRGTSCEVVENPTLLDVMDHISEKSKEEVRKILSSKHLHYEEMCSYHNGNRLHLPHDLELQRSLRLALLPRDDRDDNEVAKRHPHDDNDDVEEEAEFDGRDESEENQGSTKRLKQCQNRDDFSFGNSLNSLDCNKVFNFQAENVVDVNQVAPEGTNTNTLHKELMNRRNVELEEKKLYIKSKRWNWRKRDLSGRGFAEKGPGIGDDEIGN
ncbi:hypothetical protein DH2020_034751 [Rehmannia glutinosa]|uniref:Myb/SANT-like DNA-binding domain-containing protein n=1 Tax=Rehmannia glutinosa TaxID=99300 RepID=A0ABR0V922_REHGL